MFDDGHFTYFQWPENVSVPALFVIGPDGGESLVNYSVRDGYQVVEQTAPKFILRGRQGDHHGHQRRLARTDAGRTGAASA